MILAMWTLVVVKMLGAVHLWQGKAGRWVSLPQQRVDLVLCDTFHARLLPVTLMVSVGPGYSRSDIIPSLSFESVVPDVKRRS